MSVPEDPASPILVDAHADVDTSNPAFDFVRSIWVFEITYQQRRSSDVDRNSWETVYMGNHGEQGNHSRRRSSISGVSEVSDLVMPTNCRSYWHRSDYIEWRVQERTYG